MESVISPILRLFQSGAKSYQPEGFDLPLKPESDDPEVSVENIGRLVEYGLRIRDLLVRPTGVLVMFATGEQYYAPALRVGVGVATEALAHIANEAGFGPFDQLLSFLQDLPESYCAEIPVLTPIPLPP